MKFLVIQTAFIGDAILATAVLEKLHRFYPEGEIDFLVQKGNESLFTGHPFLHRVLVFDKKGHRLRSMGQLIAEVRRSRYDVVINLHRFFSSGLITVLSGAGKTLGFDKNPLSFFFSHAVRHEISASGKHHEVRRNLLLISSLTDNTLSELPRLYPSAEHYQKVRCDEPYICIAPASVWFTKQWPAPKWVELIRSFEDRYRVFLIGSRQDRDLCENIARSSGMHNFEVRAGDLSLLESAALMKGAVMNFVNDSAPLHLASSVNAPVTAIYCSTVPAFGFGPLSDKSRIVETDLELDCRPCGLHGYHSCPAGHFKCSEISIEKLRIPADQ